MNIIPKRWPFWCAAISRGNPVFDLYWFGWLCLVHDKSRAYHRFGWVLRWNDED